MLIVYDSLTGNVKRFIESIDLQSVRITKDLCLNEPYVLVTYSTGFGQIPDITADFLKLNSKYLKGVAVSGNKNWGEFFGKSGDTISNHFNVPLILKFEMSGTQRDREQFKLEVLKFDEFNS